MDFIHHLHIWAKGDIVQGRWMLGIAILLLIPILIMIIKSNNLLLRGAMIPIFLLLVMNLGYLLLNKQKFVDRTEANFRQIPEKIVATELARLKSADKSYTFLKYVWIISLAFSIVSSLTIVREYYKGLALGFIVMFFGMLIIDTFLHQRLNHYLNTITQHKVSKK